MKKKKILNILLILLIIFFTMSKVNKVFQNDTFFDIPIGKYIVENGIDMMDHFTWHNDLTYTYSHWLFGIIEYFIYNFMGFDGIYIMVLFISSLTMVVLYLLLNKYANNHILSFLMTMLTVYIGNNAFTARAQIITFLLFIIEFYCIEMLVRTEKWKYSIILLIIPIIIANMHASVWIIYFIFYLPYIVEFIIWNIMNKLKINIDNKKIIVNNNNLKKLMLTMFLAIFTGMLTPLGNVPYIFMNKNISGISKEYIAELQPLNITEEMGALIIISTFIGIVAFTKVKVKATDAMYMLGFLLMTLAIYRSLYYLIFIGAFINTRLINSLLKEYDVKSLEELELKLQKNKNLIFFSFLILSLSLYNMLGKLSTTYIDTIEYPVQATNFILNSNIDLEKMRLYNGFNYGSYLELNGIPAFIDSRSEMFCEEFNNTTILKDVINVEKGNISYKNIFEKYQITHVLIRNDNIINNYISEDKDYEILYQDDVFVFYEKK